MDKKDKSATNNQWACQSQNASKDQPKPHKSATDNEWTSTNKK